MNLHLAHYVIRYFDHLMSADERRAYRHLTATIKAVVRSDAPAQGEAKSQKLYAKLLSGDPNVLRLAHDGYDEFIIRTAKRILDEQGDLVFLNCCPHCGALTRTPKARHCRFCGHDWHERA